MRLSPGCSPRTSPISRSTSAISPIRTRNLVFSGVILMSDGQRARVARAHDRQQVRGSGRLLHALRRHRRCLRRHPRCLELTVYDLCTWRNEAAGRAIIPANVLTKPPSAELKPDQRDVSRCLDYEILIRSCAIRRGRSHRRRDPGDEHHGRRSETVQRVCRLVDIAEFKRRQTRSAPGHQQRHSDVIGGFPSSIGTADDRLDPRRRKHVSPDSCSQPRDGYAATAEREEVFGWRRNVLNETKKTSFGST